MSEVLWGKIMSCVCIINTEQKKYGEQIIELEAVEQFKCKQIAHECMCSVSRPDEEEQKSGSGVGKGPRRAETEEIGEGLAENGEEGPNSQAVGRDGDSDGDSS